MIEMNFCEAYCSAAMGGIDSTSCMSVCVCMCPNFMHVLSSSLIVSLTCAHLCLRVEMEGC